MEYKQEVWRNCLAEIQISVNREPFDYTKSDINKYIDRYFDRTKFSEVYNVDISDFKCFTRFKKLEALPGEPLEKLRNTLMSNTCPFCEQFEDSWEECDACPYADYDYCGNPDSAYRKLRNIVYWLLRHERIDLRIPVLIERINDEIDMDELETETIDELVGNEKDEESLKELAKMEYSDRVDWIKENREEEFNESFKARVKKEIKEIL
jgi:hypothetical protein